MPPHTEDAPRTTPANAFLGLGASLGDRLGNLRQALRRLQLSAVRILAVSRVYESPHLGLKPGDADTYPPHLNLAARIETFLTPEQLLETVQAVEAEGGRERLERWGPRTIDIDILDYDHQSIRTKRLILPHPGIGDRAFVALPLMELAPDFRLGNGELLRDRINQEPLRSQCIVITELTACASHTDAHENT